MHQAQGRITFSDLYNSDRFSPEEKGFLGRLYEVFFAIPAFLKADFEASGKVPTRSRIAEHFQITPQSAGLLLTLMEKDPRMPSLFTRDPQTQEITQINAANIDAFVQSRGSNVKMTQWEGQKLPEFTLEKIGGGKLSSSELAGHDLLVYFWFTGCPPCVRIAPLLSELAAEYEGKGMKFVGINADDLLELGTTDPSRLEYVEKQGLRFPQLKLDAVTKERFGSINVYPTLFFVSKDGKVVRHLVNFQPMEKLREAIEALQVK